MSKHVIHKHSSQVVGDGAKLISPSDIEYGELALNYSKGYETLMFKNSQDEIVTMSISDIGGGVGMSDPNSPSGTGEVFNSYSDSLFPNLALGAYSHAEGLNTVASGDYSHAEGRNTKANRETSHAEGVASISDGDYSHAEGCGTKAIGDYSHTEGIKTTANGQASHAEGSGTTASGAASHAEGWSTIAFGPASHAEGYSTSANGGYSHAEGYHTIAEGNFSHAEGNGAHAEGNYSHAEGYHTIAEGNSSHAEGNSTSAVGFYSHAEGTNTTAYANASHAEGDNTSANGLCSHTEGSGTTANGGYSHAEGYMTIASGQASHAEGLNTIAATYAHAEGVYTSAIGYYSHAEGYRLASSGIMSHAGGRYTLAKGESSFAHGRVSALSPYSVAFGNYNYPVSGTSEPRIGLSTGSATTFFSLGTGTPSAKANALEIKNNGDMYIYGVGGYTGRNSPGMPTAGAQPIQEVLGKYTLILSATNYTLNNWAFVDGEGTVLQRKTNSVGLNGLSDYLAKYTGVTAGIPDMTILMVQTSGSIINLSKFRVTSFYLPNPLNALLYDILFIDRVGKNRNVRYHYDDGTLELL